MRKSYPRSRFEIINQTSVSEIDTTTVNGTIALMMAAYPSAKGSEDWEVITSLSDFTTRKGGLNFTRYGQAQFTVANLLRSGAYVLGKRMVSNDATLAHATIRARVVQVDNKSFLYFYSVAEPLTTGDNGSITGGGVKTFKDAYTKGYANFDADAEPTTEKVQTGSFGLPSDIIAAEVDTKSYDIPLFTVTAMGRGISGITFRLVPEYYISKNGNYMRYTFEVSENVNVLESISCTFNPDAIIDDTIQSISNKVSTASGQVKVKIFEDGILKLTRVLAETATINSEKVPVSELINLDYINGKDRRENNIAGIITKSNTLGTGEENAKTLWEGFKPSDITSAISLDVAEGIPLVNGYNGTLGDNPMGNPDEYKKLLIETFGGGNPYPGDKNGNYDPVIYDVDRYKVDAVFDCGFPIEVKNTIIDLADARGDFIFFADLVTPDDGEFEGTRYVAMPANTTSITDKADLIKKSMYTSIYCVYGDIIDPFTKKQMTITLPYLLANRLVSHISTGVGKPFAGISNNLYFPEFIVDTINYKPVVVPGCDQKQILADHNVNYINYYDEVPVLESMWVNDDKYTQLSFLHNVMAVQEIIKIIRTRCPRTRYTFLSSNGLEEYLSDVNSLLAQYKTNFKSISMTYMADEAYESNNIFYAVLKVSFFNFVNEEYFKVIAID